MNRFNEIYRLVELESSYGVPYELGELLLKALSAGVLQEGQLELFAKVFKSMPPPERRDFLLNYIARSETEKLDFLQTIADNWSSIESDGVSKLKSLIDEGMLSPSVLENRNTVGSDIRTLGEVLRGYWEQVNKEIWSEVEAELLRYFSESGAIYSLQSYDQIYIAQAFERIFSNSIESFSPLISDTQQVVGRLDPFEISHPVEPEMNAQTGPLHIVFVDSVGPEVKVFSLESTSQRVPVGFGKSVSLICELAFRVDSNSFVEHLTSCDIAIACCYDWFPLSLFLLRGWFVDDVHCDGSDVISNGNDSQLRERSVIVYGSVHRASCDLNRRARLSCGSPLSKARLPKRSRLCRLITNQRAMDSYCNIISRIPRFVENEYGKPRIGNIEPDAGDALRYPRRSEAWLNRKQRIGELLEK